MAFDDLDCKGEILGNPDISGKGVVWSTWILSLLVIVMSFWVWGLLYFTAEPEGSSWYRPSTKALLALGDSQLITALALIVSSLLFITVEGDTSLYHIFVARGLVDVNMSGYGASLMLSTKDQCNFHFRWALLVILLIFYLVWNEFCIRDFQKWSDESPLCFHNENFVPGDYVTWMNLNRFWYPVGFTWVLCEPFETLRQPLEWVEDELPKKPRRFWNRIRDTWQSPAPTVSAKGDVYLILVGYISLFLLSILGVLIAIITITPPFYTPFSELLFFTWAVYDVYKVRQVNGALGVIVTCPSEPSRWKQCMRNPEQQLGFGQILPFCLILSAILQLADMYSYGKENKRIARIGNLGRNKIL